MSASDPKQTSAWHLFQDLRVAEATILPTQVLCVSVQRRNQNTHVRLSKSIKTIQRSPPSYRQAYRIEFASGVHSLNRRFNLFAIALLLLEFSSTNGALAENGVASVYSTEDGKRTASGQPLNPSALTAAHRSLPFGTKVRVSNRKNGQSIVVTINDRGPFVRGRIIDVTPAAARELGFSGLAPVTLALQ